MNITQLLKSAEEFEVNCNDQLISVAKIRNLGDGKYRVESECVCIEKQALKEL